MRSRARSFRSTRVAAGIAFLLLAFVALVVDRSTTFLREDVEAVRHTYEVIVRLDALEDALGDGENARRAYALTGDTSYERELQEARARVVRLQGEIRAATTDNEAQQRRLAALDDALAARLDALEKAVRQRGATLDVEREALATRTGTAESTKLRTALSAIAADERRLLAARREASNRALAYLRWAQLGGLGTGIALLGWAFSRSRKESAARARSETELATTLDSIADGIVATDTTGCVTRMNAVAEKLTGWTADEARGRPVNEVLVVRKNEDGDVTILVAKDGKERPILQSRATIAGDDGRAAGIVVVVHDVTALRDAYAERQRLTAFLDSIVENIPHMIFVKDAGELRFERLNKAGEELLGLSRDDMIGKNDHDFFPDEQARAFVEADRDVLKRGAVVDIAEEPIETKQGKRWLHTKKVPILGANGEPQHLLGISEDITERKADAEELRAAKESLEAANKELESFSYSVAHDLRAPLRTIDGFSQALLEDHAKVLDDAGKDYLQRIRNGARRMGELIDDLLQLSRLIRAETRMQRVDLTAAAGTIAQELRDRYPNAEVRVQEGLETNGDLGFMRVALQNLLDNALKFSSKRDVPVVELGALPDKPGVFFVKDNGVGFDVSAAKNLFGAFQRFHKPTEYRGTGIGLATVQRVVRRHGGRIWAESTPGQGTTFFFTLAPEARP